MEIRVLGPGCMKCRKLYAETERAVADAGVEADLAKVERIADIAAYGVPMTPALVIDGQVRCMGRSATAAEITGWIREAAAGDQSASR